MGADEAAAENEHEHRALELVVEANDLQYEANRLVSEGSYAYAATYCRRVAAKLDFADLAMKEAKRDGSSRGSCT